MLISTILVLGIIEKQGAVANPVGSMVTLNLGQQRHSFQEDLHIKKREINFNSKNIVGNRLGLISEYYLNGVLNTQPAEIEFTNPNSILFDPTSNNKCFGTKYVCVSVNECDENGYTKFLHLNIPQNEKNVST